MIKKISLLVLGALLSLFAHQADASRGEQLSRAENAADVLDTIIRIPENSIPLKLLQKAEGIAVFPGVIKAGFVVGGSAGKGLLAVRREDGTWSLPVYIKLAGGSIGFQAGVQSTDVVLVFTTKRSVNGLLDGTFNLGGDASIAAGPVGRSATAATNLELDAEIYSYSRSRGLFGGISLDGSKIDVDYDANSEVYGADTTPRMVFAGNTQSSPRPVTKFTDMLEEVMVIPVPESG